MLPDELVRLLEAAKEVTSSKSFLFPAIDSALKRMQSTDGDSDAPTSRGGNLESGVDHRQPSPSPPPDSSANHKKRSMSHLRKSDEGTPVEGQKNPGKRVRWTKELHQKFLDAVVELGRSAIPSQILAVMNEPELTREQVASHLQKYRKHFPFLRSLREEVRVNVCEPSCLEVVCQQLERTTKDGATQEPPQPQVLEVESGLNPASVEYYEPLSDCDQTPYGALLMENLSASELESLASATNDQESQTLLQQEHDSRPAKRRRKSVTLEPSIGTSSETQREDWLSSSGSDLELACDSLYFEDPAQPSFSFDQPFDSPYFGLVNQVPDCLGLSPMVDLAVLEFEL